MMEVRGVDRYETAFREGEKSRKGSGQSGAVFDEMMDAGPRKKPDGEVSLGGNDPVGSDRGELPVDSVLYDDYGKLARTGAYAGRIFDVTV